MRKAKLKQMHDEAVAYNTVNDAFIESTLNLLEEDDVSEEARKAGVQNLRKELEFRDTLNTAVSTYKERKAEDRGYWIGVSGCIVGIILNEVGPVLWKHFKK